MPGIDAAVAGVDSKEVRDANRANRRARPLLEVGILNYFLSTSK